MVEDRSPCSERSYSGVGQRDNTKYGESEKGTE